MYRNVNKRVLEGKKSGLERDRLNIKVRDESRRKKINKSRRKEKDEKEKKKKRA